MTREDAINLLSQFRKDGEGFLCDNTIEAFKMAIKALEQEPCDDAINREDALMCLTGEIKDTDTIETIIARFVRRIRKLPPVNTQPKTGHWIAQDIHNCHTDFKCSACGYIHSFMHIYGEPTADYTYCPNCGAKMQEIEE